MHNHDLESRYSQTLFSPTSSAISILAPSVHTVQFSSLPQYQTRVGRTNRPQEQATVQADLHVQHAQRLSAGRRDVLADGGCWDEYLSKRHRVVGQEVELQVFLCVRVGVNDTRNVDNETDRLADGVSAWLDKSG